MSRIGGFVREKKTTPYERTLLSYEGVSGYISPDVITLTFPWVTQTHNQLIRTNVFVRKRHRQLMGAAIFYALGGRKIEPFERAIVDVTRRVASASGPDDDGLIGGLKDFIDCLTTPSLTRPKNPGAVQRVRNQHGMGLIIDDSPKHMRLVARHETSKVPGLNVRITKVQNFD